MATGYSGPVTDPFRLRAPDGNTYFDILQPPHGLDLVYNHLASLIRNCQLQERRAAQAKAQARTAKEKQAWSVIQTYWRIWGQRFDKAAFDLVTGLRTIAAQTAQVADQRIKHHIAATATGRPPTSKARHMEDNILSRPVSTRPEGGIVGIADISELDKTQQGGGSYWAAQEFGTDAHVGRVVHGHFQPGNVRPDQRQFRAHPEFRAARTAIRMNIQNPIEERGFLRKGVEDAGRFRARKLEALKQRIERLIRDFLVSNAPPAPQIAPPGGTMRPPRRR